MERKLDWTLTKSKYELKQRLSHPQAQANLGGGGADRKLRIKLQTRVKGQAWQSEEDSTNVVEANGDGAAASEGEGADALAKLVATGTPGLPRWEIDLTAELLDTVSTFLSLNSAPA